MLKRLRIRNFKAWKDTGEIRMAPISLFFGTNSSGKSSIGQFLMMLKQTVESPDRKAVFYPGGKNSPVHLGSYEEMVFNHDVTKKIEFDYQWSLPDAMEFEDPISESRFSGNTVSFHATVETEEKNRQAPVVSHLKYELREGEKSTLSFAMQRMPESSKSEYEFTATPYKLVRRKGSSWPLRGTVRFYGIPDEAAAYYQNATFVLEIVLQHEQLFQSIFYLGPLRTKAERLYSWTGIAPESVGPAGGMAVAATLAARNRKISFGFKKPKKPFEEIIARALKNMGLIEEFKVQSIAEGRREYEIKVRTKGSKSWVDIPDVGFGISQVFPVLVQCFYAPPQSIILMEQPEIHLHPSAQAALADIMIDVINSRENDTDRNIQLIIETHSEHFLRRLQRRIAEGVVPQENISAYFANATENGAILQPLQIDAYGSISNWPENFFGDEMGDITEQAKAAMKKRKQHNVNRAKVSE